MADNARIAIETRLKSSAPLQKTLGPNIPNQNIPEVTAKNWQPYGMPGAWKSESGVGKNQRICLEKNSPKLNENPVGPPASPGPAGMDSSETGVGIQINNGVCG